MRNSSSFGFDIREAVENLRDAVMAGPGGRSSRGSAHHDVRAAVIHALGDEPMNGQQVIAAIGAASGGDWMPSAGEVYPTLQLLTDEGLVSTQHDGERTVYTLTDAGREAEAAMAAESTSDTGRDSRGEWRMPRMGEGWNLPEWGDRMSGRWNERWSDRWNEHWADRTSAVPRSGAKLAQAAAQVTQTGTREQQERAAALLDETRRRLYAILAED